MSQTPHTMTEKPSDSVLAEAAAWIAKLHGSERNAQIDAGLRRWLLEHPMHRAAFDEANELWLGTERLPKAQVPIRSLLQPDNQRAWPKLLAAAGIAGVLIGAYLYSSRSPSIATAIGEQRTVALEDGSRIALNTATRIKVRYDASVREVELEQGEALFDVAKDTDRPFIVTTAGRQITALGTKFVVRQDSRQLSVTLMEGRVLVERASNRSLSKVPSAQGIPLSAGQRVTFVLDAAPSIDTPDLGQVTDWQQGRIRLDNTGLDEAIAEMNRYSATQMAMDERTRNRQIKITGIFRAGDTQDFADALAHHYGVALLRERNRIILTTPAGER